jgi:hypothetical protein
MNEEKKELYRIIQSLKGASVSQLVNPQPMELPSKVSAPGVQTLPSGFIELYSLDARPNSDSNP